MIDWTPVSLDEINRTIKRMETRLQQENTEMQGHAWSLYQKLIVRFEEDLGAGSRDSAMARAGALMLVQALKMSKVHECK